jgi:large subunit ribosomal protein L6
MRKEIEIPEEVEVEKTLEEFTFSGPNGTVVEEFSYPGVSVSLEDEAVVIETDTERRKQRATLGTFESRVRNAFHGVTDGFEYEMKVLYSHFPMQVEVKGDTVEVRNFLGEKHPRETQVVGETEVDVSEEEIVLRGPNKEHVGQTAANIEQLTYTNDKDVRVFHDGIYITAKPEV